MRHFFPPITFPAKGLVIATILFPLLCFHLLWPAGVLAEPADPADQDSPAHRRTGGSFSLPQFSLPKFESDKGSPRPKPATHSRTKATEEEEALPPEVKAEEDPPPSTEPLPPPDEALLEALRNVQKSRQEVENEQTSKSKRMSASNTPAEEKAALKEELELLNANEKNFARDFERIATGMDPDHLQERVSQRINWEDEITKLVAPLFSELRQLTERPRKIEALRSELALSEQHLGKAVAGLKSLQILLTGLAPQDETLRKQLLQLQKEWITRRKRIEKQILVQRYQLEDLVRQRKSLFSSAQESAETFFKSRGRNLLLSILAFSVVFLLLRFCHQGMYRYSPLHRKGSRTFLIRLIDVTYHVLAVLGSVGAALVVLYMSGDWLLLSLLIIFLLGLAWTAKEGLPLFWRQAQLLLNLGTVREGERIIYNGVPWKVATLSLFGFLENPCFRPSRIRIPLRDLIPLVSRPWDEAEPWFPAGVGDWVLLSDDTRGEIVSAGPELVRLRLRGEGLKTYTTADFLAASPNNLSSGFRLKVVFGFDYADQASITTDIPDTLMAHLKQGLANMGHGQTLKHLRVEVESAGANSLDLVTIADFAGVAAPLYNQLRRAIQKLCIEACTAKGWNIPFAQLIVHMAPPADTP